MVRQPAVPKGKRKAPPIEITGALDWASEQYEHLIAQAATGMPAACAAALDGWPDGDSLLQHCVEVLLDQLVRHTSWSAGDPLLHLPPDRRDAVGLSRLLDR